MKNSIVLILLLTVMLPSWGQDYRTSMQKYIEDYVQKHEVVKGEEKKLLAFFPVDQSYRVKAKFKPVKNADWFNVPTSSGRTKAYRKYGVLQFKIDGSRQTLHVYQAQALLQKPEYWDYLFLPFTDKTNGVTTYETGRYIDLKTSEIKKKKMIIDFNKAYNPYCAYVSGVYNCPVPPHENALPIEIRAGEKKFEKVH